MSSFISHRHREPAVRQHCSRRIEPRSPQWPQGLIVLLCSVALVAGSGCTTTRTIDSQGEAGELHPGDTVKVSLRDGRELDLRFVEWTVDHFIGEDQTDTLRMIERQHISQLQTTRFSAVRTGLLVATIGAVLVARLMLQFAVDLGPGFAL